MRQCIGDRASGRPEPSIWSRLLSLITETIKRIEAWL